MTTSSTLEEMLKSDDSQHRFSAQRKMVREQAERSKIYGSSPAASTESQGVDRSGQLIPIVRPTFVRALSKA